MIAKIKKNDTVKVIAGEDAGKTGKVLTVNREKNVATVDGINSQKKLRKARNAQETSRIENMLGPVDLSNLMVVCPTCGKATRVGVKVVLDENGKEKKVRICKHKDEAGNVCGALLDKAEVKAAKKTAKKATKKADDEAAPKKTTRKTTKKAEGEAPVKEAKKAPRKTAKKAADEGKAE